MTTQTPERPVKLIAVIRLKGTPGLRAPVRQTLKLMRLYKKYHLAVIPTTPQYLGMMQVIKDAVTWGEIDHETLLQVLIKRGRLPGNVLLTEEYAQKKINKTLKEFVDELMKNKAHFIDIPGLKPFFKLSPPRKGLEKEGVKTQYSLGGALGYRKNNINEMIVRML